MSNSSCCGSRQQAFNGFPPALIALAPCWRKGSDQKSLPRGSAKIESPDYQIHSANLSFNLPSLLAIALAYPHLDSRIPKAICKSNGRQLVSPSSPQV